MTEKNLIGQTQTRPLENHPWKRWGLGENFLRWSFFMSLVSWRAKTFRIGIWKVRSWVWKIMYLIWHFIPTSSPVRPWSKASGSPSRPPSWLSILYSFLLGSGLLVFPLLLPSFPATFGLVFLLLVNLLLVSFVFVLFLVSLLLLPFLLEYPFLARFPCTIPPGLFLLRFASSYWNLNSSRQVEPQGLTFVDENAGPLDQSLTSCSTPQYRKPTPPTPELVFWSAFICYYSLVAFPPQKPAIRPSPYYYFVSSIPRQLFRLQVLLHPEISPR